MQTLFQLKEDSFIYFNDTYLPIRIKETLHLFEKTVKTRDNYKSDYYLDGETDQKIYCDDSYRALRELESYYFCRLCEFAIDYKDFKLVNYIFDI